MSILSDIEKRGLDAAYAEAVAGQDEGGIPIGSVLMTKSGEIVARGHNQRVQTGDSTAHAETVCIRNAGRRRDWHELVLVSTLSPCAMCTGTAVLHQIPRVIIGEHETFLGREDWMHAEGIEVVVADDERCIAIMRTFIEEHPELWNEDIGIPPEC
ncbi:MAG: nucleoside deaminase [Phycisphaerales bacterium]|nr:nucleoside deaminase [Phycisphaerales bacterium]